MGSELKNNGSPLERFPLFSFNDMGEVLENVKYDFGPYSLKVLKSDGGLKTRFDSVFFQGIPLIYSRYGADILVCPEDGGRYFFTQTTLGGNNVVSAGKQESRTKAGSTVVVSPAESYHMHLSTDCSRLLVMIDPCLSTHHLSRLINR